MRSFDPDDIKWMKRAIKLASLGEGSTSPNPLVGAVIINKHGQLISEGFHSKAGMPHAEAMAFENLNNDAKGGSLYVNLEPCCHKGKTPPCVDKIISYGIKKVFIGIEDPDKRVSGKGIQTLKDAGIDVILGICKSEALDINKAFIHKNLTGKSYGVLKWAMSIDGRVGLKNGHSKWISNENSRKYVHKMRAGFDAIIIGGNTLRKDNPLLTTRGLRKDEPLRVIFSKYLELPIKSNLWNCEKAKTLLVYDSSSANENNLKNIPSDVDIEKLPNDNPNLLSNLLAKKGFNKVLWECGPKLATAAMKNGCIQEVATFVAPKILGGLDSMNPFSDFNFENMSQTIKLKKTKFHFFEDDIYLNYLCPNNLKIY
tara:strand:- start:1627 stop:2736 length:1110 start_codon:yes stop_codon:yes gene_type:complete